MLTGCDAREPGRVRASEYDSFWLWAGVETPDHLPKAREIYLLAGEIRGEPAEWVPLLATTPKPGKSELWLVVRTNTLKWPSGSVEYLIRTLDRWEQAGNRVAGLQVDFDAATHGLSTYSDFLTSLRIDLPKRYRLSVTGLMDWSANGDPGALQNLAGVIDEVVIQTYQARSTIPGYEAYFSKMDGFPIPFKVGLVEGGLWHAPSTLEHHPQFNGYVVFLTER